MVNKINIECEAVYAIGDIHGHFNKIVEMIKMYDVKNSCIIVCGDCGFGFASVEGEKNNIHKLNKCCKNTGNYVVFVRGNHDNPDYFANGLVNTKNLVAVPDYTVLNDSILLVGGAVSIDRMYRMKKEEEIISSYLAFSHSSAEKDYHKSHGGLYWKNEVPYYDDGAMSEIFNEGIKIKHVCTHTCPSFCDPLEKDGIRYWLSLDDCLEKDIDDERKTMDMIWERLVKDGHPVQDWTYGHYHRHSKTYYEDVCFTMLDAIIADGSNIDWIEIQDKK